MPPAPTVIIVDPDAPSRHVIKKLLSSVRAASRAYATARDFLADYDPLRPACLIVELRLPDMSGLDLLDRLRQGETAPPVIIVTGHGDVPTAARAIRQGALDFVLKPFHAQSLLERIYEALERDAARRAAYQQWRDLATRAARLTAREREVALLVVRGLTNRQIAAQLGVTSKAIEAYRARVMRKMNAAHLVDLVRMGPVIAQPTRRTALHC